MLFHPVQENAQAPCPQLMTINPSGEMPVLIEEDGTVIAGAYAAMEFLEEASPGKTLLGKSHAERAEVRRLVEWFDRRFHHEVTHNLVFEKVYKKIMQQGEPDSTTIRMGKKHLYYHLDYIANLASTRGWLAGERFTYADIAAASHLSTLDYLGDVPWEYNAIAREWYALVKSRPSFRALLVDRVPSFRPPAHYENPDF